VLIAGPDSVVQEPNKQGIKIAAEADRTAQYYSRFKAPVEPVARPMAGSVGQVTTEIITDIATRSPLNLLACPSIQRWVLHIHGII
jgi:hypothetical protein